jgi:CHRD domain-containing protein
VVRRFMLAAVVALGSLLVAIPIALAQSTNDPYGSGDDSSSGGSTSSGSTSGSTSGSSSGSTKSSTSSSGAVVLRASLTGAAEVPGPGATGATGTASITIQGERVCFKLSWENIKGVNLAHIHKGANGVAGAPVVSLFTGKPVKEGCTTPAAGVAKRIAGNPGNYYVNLHTADFPSGALRGQLAASNDQLPFTGGRSDNLLALGSAITLSGLLLLYASRRFGIRPGRHLAAARANRAKGSPPSHLPW